ncbi:hypothetical protein [Bacillus xiapuensis]|uniref:Uncharacterized protein n=1 Tax=Bacillus xiapuensis TaxID=2014075 RepID=A0ABU6N5E8_9BACI|nr:hypothetical protein [Bacillus xiapuensis]
MFGDDIGEELIMASWRDKFPGIKQILSLQASWKDKLLDLKQILSFKTSWKDKLLDFKTNIVSPGKLEGQIIRF